MDSRHLKNLNGRQKRFVQEYIQDLNVERAATEAGYAHPSVAGNKLLANPKVKAALKAIARPIMQKAELTSQNVLQQLHTFLFRDIRDFIGEDGYLACKVSELPDSAAQCVDDWIINRQYDEEGNLIAERIKPILVPKTKCLELAMKYCQLLTPDNVVNVGVGLDWGKLYAEVQSSSLVTVEQQMQEVLDVSAKRQVHHANGQASIPGPSDTPPASA